MAHREFDSKQLATRVFVATMVGTVLYVGAVFIFVL